MKYIDILVGAFRAKQLFDEVDVLIVETASLFRVINFQDTQHSHHICAFGAVSGLSHHGRNDYLEVCANRYESVSVVVNGCVGEGVRTVRMVRN